MINAAQAAPEFLNTEELQDLTGYKHAGPQDGWLTFRRIPHRVDGRRVIVSRAHVRDWLEGKQAVISGGVNFGAVR